MAKLMDKMSILNLIKPGIRTAKLNTGKNTIRIIGHENLAIITENIDGIKKHKICSKQELEKTILAQSNNISDIEEGFKTQNVSKNSNKYRLLLELEMAEQGIWLQTNNEIAIRQNNVIEKYSFEEALSVLKEGVDNSLSLIKENEHIETKLPYILAYKTKSDHRYFILNELIDFIYAKRNLPEADFENILSFKIKTMTKKAYSGGMKEETPVGYDLCDDEIDDFRNMNEKKEINNFRYPKDRGDNKYIGNVSTYDNFRGSPEDFSEKTPPFSLLKLK